MMSRIIFVVVTLLVMLSCSLPSLGPFQVSSEMDSPGLFVEYSDPEGLVESHFRNGGLELEINDGDTYFWIFPDTETPLRVDLKVEASFVDGDPETGVGMVCEYDYDTDQGLYFETTFDGYYLVYKNTPSGWEYLYDFTPTSRINQAGKNTIEVVCNDGEYEFYVNDSLLVKFEDEVDFGGDIALFGYTYANPGVVRFNNFSAKGLE
jgi:hypothetical protein